MGNEAVRLAFIKKRFFIHGGAERYLQTLIRELIKLGHEIHVFANQWSDEEGIIFHKVDIIPFTSFLSTFTFNRNSRFKIQDSRFDCIISFERTTHQDIYRAGEGCHAEWLRIRSGFEPLYKKVTFKINPLHLLLLHLEKRIFRDTRLIIANSKMVKEQIIKHYGVPDDKIITIYNGVDLERFNPGNREPWRHSVRDSLGISEESMVLLFVGSGFERKGLGTLIKALPLIKADTKVLILGKGKVYKYMALAKRLGVSERILFLGAQSEIERFYVAADLFVLPTLYDPFSNATLEAMASGLPVITTNNNGAAEIIDNRKEGYVIESLSDHEELADKINLTLSNLAEMGEAARKKAEGFSIERAAEEFIKTIEGKA
ncbi:MAG: glycosyltransferase family 4 protein [Thermodesulfovibrionales bacterium]